MGPQRAGDDGEFDFDALAPSTATRRMCAILPGELAKHAVSEGTKAVTKFEAATNKK